MAKTDDEAVAEWRQLSQEVTRLAEAAAADPQQAKGFGIEIPRRDRGASGPPEPERAAWLRAAAKAVVPQAYEWEITMMIGGAAYLTLKAYHADRDTRG